MNTETRNFLNSIQGLDNEVDMLKNTIKWSPSFTPNLEQETDVAERLREIVSELNELPVGVLSKLLTEQKKNPNYLVECFITMMIMAKTEGSMFKNLKDTSDAIREQRKGEEDDISIPY